MTTATTTTGITAAAAKQFKKNHQANLTRHPQKRAPRSPITPVPLSPGQSLKFIGDRRWWAIRVANESCAVLTRTAAFSGHSIYTVIVWAEGRRGPHVSWGHEAITDKGCERIATDIEAGSLALSERYSISLDIERLR